MAARIRGCRFPTRPATMMPGADPWDIPLRPGQPACSRCPRPHPPHDESPLRGRRPGRPWETGSAASHELRPPGRSHPGLFGQPRVHAAASCRLDEAHRHLAALQPGEVLRVPDIPEDLAGFPGPRDRRVCPPAASPGLRVLAGREPHYGRRSGSARHRAVPDLREPRAAVAEPGDLALRARAPLQEAALRALRDDLLVDQDLRPHLASRPDPGSGQVPREAALQGAEHRQALGQSQGQEPGRCLDLPECQEQPCGEDDPPLPVPGGARGTAGALDDRRGRLRSRPLPRRRLDGHRRPETRAEGLRLRHRGGVCGDRPRADPGAAPGRTADQTPWASPFTIRRSRTAVTDAGSGEVLASERRGVPPRPSPGTVGGCPDGHPAKSTRPGVGRSCPARRPGWAGISAPRST